MINFHDFTRAPRQLREQEAEAVLRVLNSGDYVLGPEVARFENAWASYCGAVGCVGVGNGMDALEIGLRVLGIGAGQEVITTPMTAFATVLAILRAGAVPVLADIEADTAVLDLASVERCITPRTRALMLVHLYGQITDMGRWIAFCAEHELSLVEDAAQAHGAKWQGRAAGTFGSFAGYSFYPTKNLGALGDGGAIVSNDGGLLERARVFRNYGQAKRYEHPVAGMNSRLDELHAALLHTRLGWLDRFTEERRRVAAGYRELLRNPAVRLMAEPEAERHVYHLFVVTCDERDRLMRHLSDRGIMSLIHYPVPVHHQPPTAHLARDPQGLTAAESHARCCLSLPCHPFLSDDDVARVADAVNSFATSSVLT